MGENGRKGAGINKYNWQVQNREGDIKNSIGNGEAKELICTTCGHELSGGGGGLLEGKGIPDRGGLGGKLGQL